MNGRSSEAEKIKIKIPKNPLIFYSQHPSSEWYDQLGGTANPLTDSILDRIIHNAYTIDIRGSDPNEDISMREFYGLDKKLSR